MKRDKMNIEDNKHNGPLGASVEMSGGTSVGQSCNRNGRGCGGYSGAKTIGCGIRSILIILAIFAAVAFITLYLIKLTPDKTLT